MQVPTLSVRSGFDAQSSGERGSRIYVRVRRVRRYMWSIGREISGVISTSSSMMVALDRSATAREGMGVIGAAGTSAGLHVADATPDVYAVDGAAPDDRVNCIGGDDDSQPTMFGENSDEGDAGNAQERINVDNIPDAQKDGHAYVYRGPVEIEAGSDAGDWEDGGITNSGWAQVRDCMTAQIRRLIVDYNLDAEEGTLTKLWCTRYKGRPGRRRGAVRSAAGR